MAYEELTEVVQGKSLFCGQLVVGVPYPSQRRTMIEVVVSTGRRAHCLKVAHRLEQIKVVRPKAGVAVVPESQTVSVAA